MSSARTIRAVLVSDGRSAHLPAVLAALADSETTPRHLHLVMLADGDLPAIPPQLDIDVMRSGARTFGEAVDAVLALHGASGEEMLWLLHDDLAPAPDALTRLEATARKRPRAAVVGGAQVRWDDASRLVNVGTTVSPWGARRIGLAGRDDVNQGQYDTRDDVLAVSLAGALVTREAWERLGGLDAGYGGLGDSLDFCRRAWASGADVVIVPTALLRHAQDALYDRRGGSGLRRATHTRRRVGEWYHALVWAPWWALLPLALAVIPSALARAVVRIMQNEPRLVLADAVVPGVLLARLPHLVAARRAIAALRAEAPARAARAHRRLVATPRQVWRHVREQELGGWEQGRVTRIPSDVVRAELAARRRLQGAWLLVTTVVAVGLSAALTARWWWGLVDGQMLSGPGVGSTQVTRAQLWERTWSGMSEAGLGVPALDGSFAGMMLPLAVGGDVRLGLALVVALAPVLAAWGAWAAAGVLTRSPGMRAALALIYAAWPLFLAAVLDARVGPVVAHVALPWVVWGVVRGAGWARGEVLGDGSEFRGRTRPSPSAGMVAALALAVATTAAPALLLPALITLAVVGALAGAMRWHVWSVAVLSLVVSARALWAAVSHPSHALDILWREAGPAVAVPQLTPWQLMTGTDGTARWASFAQGMPWSLAAYAPGALALVVTVVVVWATRRSWAALVGLGVAALGAASAAVAVGVVAAWPDPTGKDAVAGWPGSGSSLLVLGLMVAMAGAYGTLPALRTGRARSGAVWARVGAGVTVGAALVPVVLMAWPGAPRGLATTVSPHVVPLAVPLEMQGPYRQRALVLATDAEGVVHFTVLASDGSEDVTGRVGASPEGGTWVSARGAVPGSTPERSDVSLLAQAVATVAAGGTGGTADLAAWGIGVVVVPPGEQAVQAALDANAELTLTGGGDHGTVYGVRRHLSAVPPSRAWLVTTDAEVVVPSAGTHGTVELAAGTGGVLVVATPAHASWRATLNGERLTATVDEYGRQAFAVPSTGGTLAYEFVDGAYRTWWWAAALATAWVLLGAVPLGARGIREGVDGMGGGTA